MPEYGYIRVSHTDQNDARQRVEIEALGIPPKNIFTDKQSGKDFHRPAYEAMCRRLRKGDIVFVKSIDRFGRNYEEIQEQWRILTRKKDVDIVVLDMPLLDTRRDKNLLGTFIADLVLQVLSFVAQSEREAIRQRQAEGIAAAKARGVRFGRAKVPLPDNFHDVAQNLQSHRLTLSQAAEMAGMSRTTLRRRMQEAGY